MMDTKQLLSAYDEQINLALKVADSTGTVPTTERALFRLLIAHEKEITGLIETDATAEWFHKAFRQIDVTDSGDIDMAIWLLLQRAPIFWKVIEDKGKYNWDLEWINRPNVVQWHDIASAPKDKTIILVWHKIHKVPIAVRFMSGKNTVDEKDAWVEKTLTTIWPIEAFTHWTEMINDPQNQL